MKKYTVSILLALLMGFSSPTWACTNGYEFTGYYNNQTTYCVSTVTMNWWSAFAWCQAQGYHLATFEETCPSATSLSVGDGWNSGYCGDISRGHNNYKVDGAWIARAWQTDNNQTTMALHLGDWNTSNTPNRATIQAANRTAKYKALCIEQTFPKNYVIMGAC